MAKYAKNDCRNNAKRLKKRKAFSHMRWLSVFTGENRHERRAIGARFRAVYGLVAFLEMKKRAKKHGIIDAVKAWVKKDAEMFEAITRHKLA